jgi:hypothetical protein
MADDWPRSLIAPVAVGGTAVLVMLGFGVYFAGLSLVFLFIALGRYFIPTYYELGPNGVRTRFMGISRERPWEFYRNYYPHDIGVHLTPLTSPGALDPFRGQFVRFWKNKNEVISYIAGRIRKDEA